MFRIPFSQLLLSVQTEAMETDADVMNASTNSDENHSKTNSIIAAIDVDNLTKKVGQLNVDGMHFSALPNRYYDGCCSMDFVI